MPGWTPVFLLPNLRLKESVAVDEAAMVAVDDERIRAYCRPIAPRSAGGIYAPPAPIKP